MEDEGKILILGDPAVTAGMAEGMKRGSVIRAFYADRKETEAWYGKTLALAEDHCPGLSHVTCFHNREELETLTEKADVIYGERLFKEVLGDRVKGKKWVLTEESLLSKGISLKKA